MTKNTNLGLKITKIVFLSLFYILIAFLLMFAIATLSRRKDDQVPNLFGKGFLAVDSRADSMTGNNKDSFKPGDLIFVNVLSKKDQENLDLEKLYNDSAVISFYDRSIRAINTHRVVEYGVSESGREYIRTQGDKEGLPMDNIYLEKEDVIAIYSGKLVGFGKPVNFMQTPMGFAVLVVLPMLVLLVYQAVVLMVNVFKVREDKLKEAVSVDQELERERLKQEILKELMDKEEKK